VSRSLPLWPKFILLVNPLAPLLKAIMFFRVPSVSTLIKKKVAYLGRFRLKHQNAPTWINSLYRPKSSAVSPVLTGERSGRAFSDWPCS